ncbi:MAG: acyloxyacyl hydrolase [Opitutaceae bacterium]|nr:acyloxyacyl hydrolase [Opitutaceae bacterium]
MKNLKKFRLLLFVLGCVVYAPSNAQASGHPEVVTGVGLLNVFNDDESSQWMGSVEYRFSEWQWSLQPWVGAAGAKHGTAFVSTGLIYVHETKSGIRLAAAFAPTLYDANSGRDLGSTLQFYSFGELGYTFNNHHVLGVRLGHLSNGGFACRNPGVETLLLTYTLPLSARK